MVALSPQTVMFGNPPTSGHQPSRSDLSAWMTEIESLAAGGGLSYINDSLANLDLRVGVVDGQYALVLTTEPEAGVYERFGGAWEKRAEIPAVFIESLAAAEALASKNAAAASAAAALTSKDTSVGAAAEATSSAAIALAAAEASGDVHFVETKAEADAVWGSLPVDSLIEVMIDESRDDQRTRYKVAAGALDFLLIVGGMRPDLNLAELTDAAVARGNLDLGAADIATFGGLFVDGTAKFLKGVTGGGYGLFLTRVGDRISLVVTDKAGGYLWTREISFDHAADRWSIEGGLIIPGGAVDITGWNFEKIAFTRADFGTTAGLCQTDAGLMSFRSPVDRAAGQSSIIFEDRGPQAGSPQAAITREKGDARYQRATASSFEASVNFNGTGTVAIRGSGGNIAGITDNGVGDYTVNFAVDLPDANYSPLVVAGLADGSRAASQIRNLTVSGFDIYVNNHGNGYGVDAEWVSAVVITH
jgi:hypothetical protein